MQRLTIALALVSLIVPMGLSAHGAGASVEREVGNYVVDIGYEPAEIIAGESVRFDFALYTRDGAAAPFDRVWLRVEWEGWIVFAGGISRASLGTTGATVRLTEAGPHALTVRFEKEGEPIAELETEIAVAPGEDAPMDLPWWASVLIGLGALAAGALLGRRMRRG